MPSTLLIHANVTTAFSLQAPLSIIIVIIIFFLPLQLHQQFRETSGGSAA
jgi:hypothetical protein